MSRTLDLADQLLSIGRTLHQHGQHKRAARMFAALTGLHGIPSDIAEEAHLHLAEIDLELGRPREARRHLAAAIARQPERSQYQYLMAVAIEEDEDCDQARAEGYYRRALAHDPDNAEILCDYAHYALHQGRSRRAVVALQRVAALAPDNPDLLGRVAQGLRRAHKADEARQLLRAALFRNPHDRRFRELWATHQFDMLHEAQQPAQPNGATVRGTEPVILRLPRRRKKTQSFAGKTIRTDDASELRGPTILPMHVARKKNA